MEKTVFRATIIVAGTNKARSAAKVEETASPIPIPISDPVTLSIPNLLTTTKTAPAHRKVWESLPATCMNPTIKPRITSMAYICALYVISAGMGRSVVESPIATARTTPMRNAFAPTEFSRDFITIFSFLHSASKLYKLLGKIKLREK